MAVAGDRRRSRTLRIWVRRQPGLETRIFTNSPSFLGTVCHRGFGETYLIPGIAGPAGS